MKTKSLIAGIITALALSAGFSTPAFAEYTTRYYHPAATSASDQHETTDHVAANSPRSAAMQRRIRFGTP